MGLITSPHGITFSTCPLASAGPTKCVKETSKVIQTSIRVRQRWWGMISGTQRPQLIIRRSSIADSLSQVAELMNNSVLERTRIIERNFWAQNQIRNPMRYVRLSDLRRSWWIYSFVGFSNETSRRPHHDIDVLWGEIVDRGVTRTQSRMSWIVLSSLLP